MFLMFRVRLNGENVIFIVAVNVKSLPHKETEETFLIHKCWF